HHRDHRDREYSSRRHYHHHNHRDYERGERYSSTSGNSGSKRSAWSGEAKKTAVHQSSSNGHDVSSEDGKLRTVGDWSEHISSSKRKYYYNCVSEVSQWEKPREWLDYEQQQAAAPSVTSSRRRIIDDEQTQPRHHHLSSTAAAANNNSGGSNSNNNGHKIPTPALRITISSSRDSTPVSEEEDRLPEEVLPPPLSAALPSRVASHPPVSSSGAAPNSHTSSHEAIIEVVNNSNNCSSSGGSNFIPANNNAAIATTNSTSTPSSNNIALNNNGSISGCSTVVSTHDALKTIQSALLLTSSNSGGCSLESGPPTPTHSEEPGPYPHHLLLHQQPASESPPLPSLSSLKPPPGPSPPFLSPNLAKLYKDSLVSHGLEKLCQRVNEEHTNISNLGITKVSADLKMARSLVRLAEIQATLQEQRILFLRQQSLDLDNMKLNSNLVQAASGSVALATGKPSPPRRISSTPQTPLIKYHSSHPLDERETLI
ncbi:Uncharacterized protein FKW44_006811, partial [Caligus rogercresseyi]